MQPAVIEGWQVAPGAPKDWNPEVHGHCGALPIRVDQQNGVQFMRSAWEPTPAEVAAIVAGAKVELGVAGSGHPVVNLGVGPVPAKDGVGKAFYSVAEEADDNGDWWIVVTGTFNGQSFERRERVARSGQLFLRPSDQIAREMEMIRYHAEEAGVVGRWVDGRYVEP